MNSIPLSQVLRRLESGSRPRGGVSNDTGTIPSLGGEHLTSDGRLDFTNRKTISEAFFRDLQTGVIRRGDILIVKDGATTGKTAFVGEDFPFEHAAINEHVFRLDVDRQRASPVFVFHFLRSPEGQRQIVKQIRGAAIGGINRSFVDNINLPNLSLDDQQRIAALLDKADTLHRSRQESLQLTESLLQSVFIEMFGNERTPKCPRVKLSEHLDFVTSGGRGWAKYYSAQGDKFIRLLLAWLGQRDGQANPGRKVSPLKNVLLVFGRVPMFYYLLHLYLIHILAIVIAVLFRQPVAWLFHGAVFGNTPEEYGHGLPFVYLMWVTTVVILYFPCRWWAGLKQRRKDWWLSYL